MINKKLLNVKINILKNVSDNPHLKFCIDEIFTEKFNFVISRARTHTHNTRKCTDARTQKQPSFFDSRKI